MNIYTAVHQAKELTINRYEVTSASGNFFVTSLVFATEHYDDSDQMYEVRIFEHAYQGMTVHLDPRSLPLPEFIKE